MNFSVAVKISNPSVVYVVIGFDFTDYVSAESHLPSSDHRLLSAGRLLLPAITFLSRSELTFLGPGVALRLCDSS